MVDNRTLDGSYWGGRQVRPSNGGEIVITGGGKHDPNGGKIADGSVVTPKPGGMPGFGIFPVDKDPSPRNT
jgi:hypothetical protein